MMMRSIPTVLASLLFLGASNVAMAASEPAQVATLNRAEGTVMVDKGKGFASLKAPATLNEGDRVITLSGSGAEIVFVDGCKAQLKANNMMTIALNPGCKAAIVAVNGAAAAGGTAAGAGAAGAGATTISPVAMVAAPLLVGGAIAALAGSGNDDTPISGQ